MARSPVDAFLEALREPIVEEVARATPDLAVKGGVEGLREDVAELLEHLSAAAELDAPQLFAAHVAWTRAVVGRASRVALSTRCLEAVWTRLDDEAGLPARELTTLRESLRLGLETLAAARGSPPPRPRGGEVEAYLAEAAGGRRQEALARVERWRAAEGPVSTLLRLARAQRDAGERWYAGELPVAIEHRITAVTGTAVHRLAPPPGGKRRAVFACAPGNFHGMGPAIAAALLGHHGWDVENLGPDTPPEELARLVADVRPAIVGIGVAPLAALPGARDAARAVRAAWPRVVLVAGGWAARVAGAGLLGVDRVEPGTYAGAGPATDEADRRARGLDGPEGGPTAPA